MRNDIILTNEEHGIMSEDLSLDTYISLQKKIEKQQTEPTSPIDISHFTVSEKNMLELLNRASSMKLTEDVKNPYQKSKLIKSCLPDDFTNEELDCFISIVDYIPCDYLKARISDILWYRKYKKNISYAQTVVKIYLTLSIDDENFFCYLPFWKRGLNVAMQINDKNSIEVFKQKIFDFLFNSQFGNNLIFLQLIEMLRSFNLCIENATDVIKLLIKCAEKLEDSYNMLFIEKYYDEASQWERRFNKNDDKYIELQIKRVNSYINEADKYPKGLWSVGKYQTALQILRTLPKAKRIKHFSEEQENNLLNNIKQSVVGAIQDMEPISFSIDSNDLTILTIKNIRSKDKNTALKNFASQIIVPSYSALKSDTVSNIMNFPLFAIIPKKQFSKDGRLVSNSTGVNNLSNLNEDDTGVCDEMIRNYKLIIELITKACIIPSLKIIQDEHKINIDDIAKIVQNSKIIPIERIGVFSKGLLMGFVSDFVVSLHLLVPQIENLIRVKLQEIGIKTSVIESDTGIEQEKGLSSLVEQNKENLERIFGEDLAFELKALFCDGAGPNLRNNVAHGLLDEAEMNSVYSVYCWWFCFRLMYCHNLDNQTSTETPKGADQ